MGHCNSYGFSGGFAAVLAAISWFLVENNQCKLNVSNVFSDKFTEEHLRLFLYVGIVAGVVLFLLSFFDFAGLLYEVALLFYVAVLAILATAGGMFYATWLAFNMPCKSYQGTFIDSSSLLGHKNVFQAEDPIGITVTTLNLVSGLLLFSAAISFGRRY